MVEASRATLSKRGYFIYYNLGKFVSRFFSRTIIAVHQV